MTAEQWHAAAMNPPPPPPRHNHKTRNIILAIIVGVCLVIFISCVASVGNAVKDVQTGGDNDVTLSSCSGDGTTITAQLSVTNSSQTTKQYSITVAFLDDAGNQIDTGNAFVQDLAPGQSASPQALGLDDQKPASCRITDVSRF